MLSYSHLRTQCSHHTSKHNNNIRRNNNNNKALEQTRNEKVWNGLRKLLPLLLLQIRDTYTALSYESENLHRLNSITKKVISQMDKVQLKENPSSSNLSYIGNNLRRTYTRMQRKTSWQLTKHSASADKLSITFGNVYAFSFISEWENRRRKRGFGRFFYFQIQYPHYMRVTYKKFAMKPYRNCIQMEQ